MRLLYLQLYGNLVDKFNNVEIDFSLSPDEDINLGNIFGLFPYMYILRGRYGNLRKRFKLTCIWTLDMLYLY